MHRNEWFSILTSISEKEWDFTLDTLPKNIIKYMGNFEQISIGELKKKIKDMDKQSNKPTLKVLVRDNKLNEHLFDTSSLQFNGANHTMYQVASNFNCLELANKNVNPFSGYFLTKLMSDITQGPSASGGAGYGAILRVATNKKKKINLLENTCLKPENGKLEYDDSYPNVDINLIKVGLHTDVEASFDRSKGNFKYKSNGPIIDQVFTSTCICRLGQSGKLSETLLQASYEGTYLSAVLRKSKKLVLTLIGGGSFNNPIEQITKAITNAHNKYGAYLHSNCEVILPIYDDRYRDVVENLEKNMEIELVKIM